MIIGAKVEESTAESTIKCNDIVNTVLDYGVTQEEILHIIKIFALQLEDREKMLSIVDVINR